MCLLSCRVGHSRKFNICHTTVPTKTRKDPSCSTSLDFFYVELKHGFYLWVLHGRACPPKSYILMKARFRQSTCKLSNFKRKCNCDCPIRVIVLLEWLTALLEYLDLASHLIQALNELLGALNLASY